MLAFHLFTLMDTKMEVCPHQKSKRNNVPSAAEICLTAPEDVTPIKENSCQCRHFSFGIWRTRYAI